MNGPGEDIPMVVNHRRRWAVALPPKTGSTSLLLVLTHPPFNGVNLHPAWHHEVADPGPGYRVYASVRDPFGRAVSLHIQRGRSVPGAEGEPFAGFAAGVLADVAREPRERLPAPWAAGVAGDAAADPRYYRTASRCLGDLPLAGPLRLECLRDDLIAAGLAAGRPFSLPRENVGLPGGAWQRYYAGSPGAMAAVRAWGAEDFARFGYDPGDDP